MKTLLFGFLAFGSITAIASSQCEIRLKHHPVLNSVVNPVAGVINGDQSISLLGCINWATSYASSGTEIEYSFKADTGSEFGSDLESSGLLKSYTGDTKKSLGKLKNKSRLML
ncbi:MAG: hypothetical protein ACOYL6_15895 [Bacteriovoracaceae bacterium]